MFGNSRGGGLVPSVTNIYVFPWELEFTGVSADPQVSSITAASVVRALVTILTSLTPIHVKLKYDF